MTNVEIQDDRLIAHVQGVANLVLEVEDPRGTAAVNAAVAPRI